MSRNYDVDDILDEISRKKSSVPSAPARRVVVTRTEEIDTRPIRRQAVATEQHRRRVVEDTPPKRQLPRREEKLQFGRNVRTDLEELDEYEDDEPRSISIGSAVKRNPNPPPPQRPHRNYEQEAPRDRNEGFRLNLNFDDTDELEKTQMNIPTHKSSRNEVDGRTRTIKGNKADRFERELEDEPSYKKGREKKINQFVLNTDNVEREHTEFDYDDDTYQDDILDDYTKPSDKSSVAKDINSIKTGLFIRVVLSLILFGVSTYFAIAQTNVKMPLPTFMFPEQDPRMFVAVNLGIMVLTTLVCNTTVGGGLVSLFTLKADNDSAVALASIAAIAGGIAMVITPTTLADQRVHMYFPLVILGLIFNTIGKLLMINRISINFELVSDDDDKKAMLIVKNRDLARNIMRGYNIQDPVIAYGVRTNFLSQFLDLSYSEDNTENISKISTPTLAIFSIVAAIATYFFNKDVYVAITAFTAMLCICSPLTATIIGNLPLYRTAKSLEKQGSMISGYTALENFSEVDAVILRDNELFERGAVTLHGIKAFAQERIDEAILDAASVICKSNGILTDIFMQMIGAKIKLLKPVDSIVYEDGMGISAWVAGKRVLIGNRELMMHHDVDAPSSDYEMKFVRDGREVLYISNSGELTAMFVVSYHGTIDIVEALSKFAKKDITMAVYTNNPNITSDKLSMVFKYPEDLIKILPSKLHGEYEKLIAPKEKARADIAYTGNIISKLEAIRLAISAKSAITIGSILQLIGVFLGYAWVVFFAFTGSMSVMNFTSLLIFQLFFSFVTILIPNLRKY